MKKSAFYTVLILIATGFASCGDKTGNGGDLTISAIIEKNADKAKSEVDEVRAVGFILQPVYIRNEVVAYKSVGTIIIASAPFEEGGFTITLPEKIDERLLVEMNEARMPKGGLKVSSKKAKITSVYSLKAYKNNELAGSFYCEYTSPDHSMNLLIEM
ncbi:MAG: hypothetical protein LBB53_05960 [Prevotellaceae bacterium]|jgi:hypothetical protein|nr:hypothetical protein [Prevotellaceae bacterium]